MTLRPLLEQWRNDPHGTYRTCFLWDDRLKNFRSINAVTGSRVKLGSWPAYLAMREGTLRLNAGHRDLLSNDLQPRDRIES